MSIDNQVIKLSEKESTRCVRSLASKISSHNGIIKDYLLKNYEGSVYTQPWGTIKNLYALALEDIHIRNIDSVMLSDCLISSSIIETQNEDTFLPFLSRNNFEHCIFIKIDLTDSRWFDCIFKRCLFINCKINSCFCNTNQIQEEIYFNEETYDENKNILTECYPMACPAEGSIIAWKKVRSVVSLELGPVPYLVKLLIPEDAQRSSGFSSKCRASKAIVLDIINPKTMKPERVAVCSIYNPVFNYQIGETIEPTEPFEPDRFIECGPGIHFFLNKYEALHY